MEVIVVIWGVEIERPRQPGRQARNPLTRNARLPQLQGRLRARRTDHRAQILQEGHIPPERMTGSWAGAWDNRNSSPRVLRWRPISMATERELWTCYPTCWPRSRIILKQHGAGSPVRRWGHQVQVPDGLRLSQEPRHVPRMGTLGVPRADGGDCRPPICATRRYCFFRPARGSCVSGHENFE